MKRTKQSTIGSFFSKRKPPADTMDQSGDGLIVSQPSCNQVDEVACCFEQPHTVESNSDFEMPDIGASSLLCNTNTANDTHTFSCQSFNDTASTMEVEERTDNNSEEPELGSIDEDLNVERDPGKRSSIKSFDSLTREKLTKEYIRLGPFQPIQTYPEKADKRRFRAVWYKHPSCRTWLEYSTVTDKAYCLYCFLFPHPTSSNQPFVQDGYNDWKHMMEKNRGIDKHVGTHNSVHNQAFLSCESFVNHSQSINYQFANQNKQLSKDNKARLMLSIKTVMHLVLQALPFRGDDESETSLNRGNFIETLNFKAEGTSMVAILKTAPKNAKHTSPNCQKEFCRCFANIVQENIRKELGDKFFAVIIDEARDCSGKEWFVLVIRFIDNQGNICERVMDFLTVTDTCSETLFKALCDTLNKHSLSIMRVRGQSYDGASNMRGIIAGLQAKVRDVINSAYYIHCCAHRLNLVVVKLCSSISVINSFFHHIQTMHNLISNSPTTKEMLKNTHRENLDKLLADGIIESGTGLHQANSIGNLSATRWSSHYKGLANTDILFDSLLVVLDEIAEKSTDNIRKAKAETTLLHINSLDFVFNLKLMTKVLKITFLLSKELQSKSQCLGNAARLVNITIENLKEYSETGFDELLTESVNFCNSHKIEFTPVNEIKVTRGRPRKESQTIRDALKSLFDSVFNLCIEELENRFSGPQCNLMRIIGHFDVTQKFQGVTSQVLLEVVNMFQDDFTDLEKCVMEIDCFLKIIQQDQDLFNNCDTFEKFLKKFILENLHLTLPNIFKMLTILLTLPVTTCSAERSFSALKIIKSRLRSKMCDIWTSNQLVVYTNKDISKNVTPEEIYDLYVKSAPHRAIS